MLAWRYMTGIVGENEMHSSQDPLAESCAYEGYRRASRLKWAHRSAFSGQWVDAERVEFEKSDRHTCTSTMYVASATVYSCTSNFTRPLSAAASAPAPPPLSPPPPAPPTLAERHR